MKPSITRILVELYGVTRSLSVAPELVRELSYHDVFLIAYADQLREAGRAPLATLADFAGTHLRGVISGIHLLPFYVGNVTVPLPVGGAVKSGLTFAPYAERWERLTA